MKPWIVIPTIRATTDVYDYLWSTMPEEARNRSITVYQNEPVQLFIQKMNGNIEISIKENLFEYGAWLAVYKLVQESMVNATDWFLMIHDSCAFEKNTMEKINELCCLLTRTNIEFYSLSNFGLHNLSLVRNMGVWRIVDYLAGLPVMTKDDAIALEGEGLFKILGNHVDRGEDCRGTEHCGLVWFASGKKSVVRIYSINLLKFYKVQDKSNEPNQTNEDVAVHRAEAPGGDRAGDEPLCAAAP
jgi:hypothetical protein